MSRIWIFSLILEPFLYFNVFGDSSTGNLSKLLQIVVLLGLICGFKRSRLIQSFSLFKYIYLFFLYSIFSTAIFFLFAAIAPGVFSDILSPYSLNVYSFSPRFVIDFFSIAYKFIYFVVLAPIFLRTDKDFSFLYKTFLFFTVISLFLGSLDFILQLYGFDLIPRHFNDGVDVGLRFHGLWGEPRDAAVFLSTIFLLFPLLDNFYTSSSFAATCRLIISNKPFIIAALILTVSFSFIVSILLFGLFYLFSSLSRISFRKLIVFILLSVFVIVLFSGLIAYVPRLHIYYQGFLELSILDEYNIPNNLKNAYNNIYPLTFRLNECLNSFIIPSIFGSGNATSSSVNSLSLVYNGDYENPNSQLVRLLFEHGILGASLYIFGYLYAFRRIISSIVPSKYYLEVPLLLAFCATLAHRSSLDFIALGIFYAYYIYKRRFSPGSCSKSVIA